MQSTLLRATALAIGCTVALSAGAEVLSKEQYKSGKEGISSRYKVSMEACTALAGNAKDICKVEARGVEKVATVELKQQYEPSRKSAYKVSIAKADANYALAREKCDDQAGNEKDVCVKEAKAIRTGATADAKALLKTTDANKVEKEQTGNARMEGNEARNEANSEAAAQKRKADYSVAREKCDKFSADAKAVCIKDAKAMYGQS